MTDIPPVPPAPPAPVRQLRRSNTDRVAAGVAGGLGEYFGLDPVLFRVLFAVTSFFGGAGIVAYLLAWILIPDHNTVGAPIDRAAAWLRRHRIPFWLVATVVLLVGWATFFSWWAPLPAGGVLVAIVILAVAFARRSTVATVPAVGAVPATPAVDPEPPVQYLPETRAWIAESRARRRRTAPVGWATMGVLVAALGGLAIADAVSGIRLPVYFWVGGGIVAAGLITGLILRRTPWVISVLLIPALAGSFAFGNTDASLHDGVGRTVVIPASAGQVNDQYRLAFGQLVLDLKSIPTIDAPRTIDITMASGQVQLKLPKTLNASVHAVVHVGDVRVDDVNGHEGDGPGDGGGVGYTRDVAAPSGATGAVLIINVHLASGDVQVDHV